ncbi:hypothetical protein BD626DRAFT_506571 [Schizophyllum amplum]|uniref:DUF6697 domain-containing protein n=1 Tax=Schizophyllum amplum TaxID=97359 RepID=A0A550C4X4_9AGAR|nr:hypothetical protein BD626DRAFT_506571 [Auriculariopsis ampla]
MRTIMPSIPIDATLAPEIVEFWGRRYREVKEELEELKAASGAKENCAPSGKIDTHLSSLRKKDKVARDVLSSKKDEILARRLRFRAAALEADRVVLTNQVQAYMIQAAALAAESCSARMATIHKVFPPTSFVDKDFQAAPVVLAEPEAFMHSLPPQYTSGTRLYFLPRPPACMPLHVPRSAQPGYWFYPVLLAPADTHFELIVEGSPGQWTYLGRYVTVNMPGQEMKLSEWMMLDERTKQAHCHRIAAHTTENGQTPSVATQLEVRRRYDTGEWNVPCYSLQCIGYDLNLYATLHEVALATSRRGSLASDQGTVVMRRDEVSRENSLTPSTVELETGRKRKAQSPVLGEGENMEANSSLSTNAPAGKKSRLILRDLPVQEQQ